jgi:hypothetical protein
VSHKLFASLVAVLFLVTGVQAQSGAKYSKPTFPTKPHVPTYSPKPVYRPPVYFAPVYQPPVYFPSFPAYKPPYHPPYYSPFPKSYLWYGW